MDLMLAELRQALSSLRRTPVFAVGAGIVFATAIAAPVIAFALVQSLVLDPLPVDRPDRLYVVEQHIAGEGTSFTNTRVPLAVVERWRDEAATVSGVAAVQDARRGAVFFLSGDAGAPRRLAGARVSPGYFRVLGASVARGRDFDAGDQGRPLVVLSHRFWVNGLGERLDVIGSSLRLNGELHEVIGVMPPDLIVPHPRVGLEPGEETALWAPISASLSDDADHVIVRIRGEIPSADARADLARLWEAPPPGPMTKASLALVPFDAVLLGGASERLEIIAWVGALILLLGIANIAGLLVARAAARERETAVRWALGASWRALVRYRALEGLAIAVVSLPLAMLLTVWGLELARWLLPPDMPRLRTLRLSLAPVVAAVLLATLGGLSAGLVPAVTVVRRTGYQLLRTGGAATASGRTTRTRAVLLVLQLGIALALLDAAGLLVRSVGKVHAEGAGIIDADVLVADLHRPYVSARRVDDPSHAAAYTEIVRRVQQIPGVAAAGITTSVPWRARDYVQPGWRRRLVDGGYFEVLRMPLVSGRTFSPADSTAVAPAVINESLARARFGTSNPIGALLDDHVIIGVVADARHTGPHEPPQPAMYVDVLRSGEDRVSLIARVPGGAAGYARALREAIHSVDPEQPVGEVRSLATIAARSPEVGRRLFALRTLALLSGLAIVLAATGVHASAAQHVADRRREIGVRLAMGATRLDVVGLLGRRIGVLVAGGILIGALVKGALVPALRSSLFGVAPGDPLAFISAAGVLAAAALLAIWLPTRRATRIAPMDVLRTD